MIAVRQCVYKQTLKCIAYSASQYCAARTGGLLQSQTLNCSEWTVAYVGVMYCLLQLRLVSIHCSDFTVNTTMVACVPSALGSVAQCLVV